MDDYSLLHFLKGQPWPLFVYFRSFQTKFLQKKLGVSGIWIRIVGVEGEHADHLTTTTALDGFFLTLIICINYTYCRSIVVCKDQTYMKRGQNG